MISVIGGGTMGAGIAASFLAVGRKVVLVEADPERTGVAKGTVVNSIERMARKNENLDVSETVARLKVTTDVVETVGSEAVIEAVPEILDLKRSIFASLDTLHGAEVTLASNTSSLSVTSIAEGLEHSERVIGMHFFNPVPVSSLVEIVVGADTADVVVAATTALVAELDKTPITVTDSPGFASSRLGLVLGLEAIRMVEAGVATAVDIDTAMELGYRHPMGPLKLTDLVGLDVRLNIAEHLASELGERFEPPALMRQMVADGKLGKKTGSGFYEWN